MPPIQRRLRGSPVRPRPPDIQRKSGLACPRTANSQARTHGTRLHKMVYDVRGIRRWRRGRPDPPGSPRPGPPPRGPQNDAPPAPADLGPCRSERRPPPHRQKDKSDSRKILIDIKQKLY